MFAILAIVSVLTFGAIPDDFGDDRAAFQAAITQAAATGGDVYAPPGSYVIGRAGSAYLGVLLPGGVCLRGAGQTATTLRQPPVAAGVQLVRVTGAGVCIEDLTLDGALSSQTPDEHRHGLFAQDATGLRVRRVTARGFTGDGMYLYTAADTELDTVIAAGNGRNGVTLGGQVTGVRVHGSQFVGNVAQQFDSEPGGGAVVSDVSITDSVLDGAGASGDFALTISGSSTLYPGSGWRVTRNVINGGVFVVWATDVMLGWNSGANPTTRPSLMVSRAAAVRAIGNDLAADSASAAVLLEGTAGSGPSATISGNRLRAAAAGAYGVRASGAVNVSIVGNEIAGAATGVYLRATVLDRPFERATVADNLITAGGRGVAVAGNATAQLLQLEVTRNVIAAPTPLALDDGSGAVQASIVHDNGPAP